MEQTEHYSKTLAIVIIENILLYYKRHNSDNNINIETFCFLKYHISQIPSKSWHRHAL